MPSIAENWKLIQKSISGFSGARSISVVGVTKFQPLAAVVEALDAGLSILGVNYVQDGELLKQELEKSGASKQVLWHFIGHIQSRKVKHLLYYDCVQSLDRIDIAKDLDHRLSDAGKSIDVLVEVNIANEPTKSGVLPGALSDFLAELSQLNHLRLRGLMGMPPPLHPIESRRPHFQELNQMFEKARQTYSLTTLSMGTSEDFQLAISQGATMVRLGTTLFGARA